MEKRGRFSLAAADDIDDDAVAVAVAMVVVAKKRRHSPDWQSLREERKGEEEGENTFLSTHAHAFLKCVLLKRRLKTSMRFVHFKAKKAKNLFTTLKKTTSHSVHQSPNTISKVSPCSRAQQES